MRLSTWRAAWHRALGSGRTDAPGRAPWRRWRWPRRDAAPTEDTLGRAWLWYLACYALLALWYTAAGAPPLSPRATDLARTVPYLLAGLAAVVAMAAGIHAHHPLGLAAWRLLLAGIGLHVAADGTYNGLRLPSGSIGFPSPADALYLAGYPLLIAGLLALVRARARGRDRVALLDALIVTIGLGLLVWKFLIEPNLGDPGVPLVARLVAIAYPLLDLLLLAVAIRLMYGRATWSPALALLTAAFATLLVADAAYAALSLLGRYSFGGSLELGWIVAYGCFGAAALHPSMRTLAAPEPAPSGSSGRGRIALLVAAGLLPPLLIATGLAGGDLAGRASQHDVQVLTVAMLGLAVLVFLRITTLTRIIVAQARAQQRLLDQSVGVAEKERAQIAVELHDGPIQRLTQVGLAAELARRHIARGRIPEALELLDQIGGEVSSEITALRQIMAELHPPILAESGLVGALRAHTEEFERRHGIRCVGSYDQAAKLDPNRELVLYRIAQEALTNVAKHAGASTVWLGLEAGAEDVRLTVRDDGIGFTDATVASGPDTKGHYGLAGMRRRAQMADGELEVHSRPGEGTTITVTLPYPAAH